MRPAVDKTARIITRDGVQIGSFSYVDGVGKIEITIETNTDEQIFMEHVDTFTGVVDFMFPDTRSQADGIEIKMDGDQIEKEYNVQRSLNEKQIKQKGYVWKFHKSDQDAWPSELHGHDYERGLKIDAITGAIYDVVTKKRCFEIKEKSLKDIQKQLRESSDFSEKVVRILGPESPSSSDT